MVKPFDLVYKLMTTRFKLIDSINCGSPFILMTEISCTSPWELLIVEAKLKLVFLQNSHALCIASYCNAFVVVGVLYVHSCCVYIA